MPILYRFSTFCPTDASLMCLLSLIPSFTQPHPMPLDCSDALPQRAAAVLHGGRPGGCRPSSSARPCHGTRKTAPPSSSMRPRAAASSCSGFNRSSCSGKACSTRSFTVTAHVQLREFNEPVALHCQDIATAVVADLQQALLVSLLRSRSQEQVL